MDTSRSKMISETNQTPSVTLPLWKRWKLACAKLAASDSKSLLKKYLTKEVFDALKNKKTSFGSTLLDCVQSGTY
ncbi:arginine kinase-like [Aedes aegypti]|uniref:Phosphagen kinase N-terminal domain-containing protein n=1 Tax=Aedes aegypti TaxID=7159 RepID=A0A903VGA3_AEDAE|nr:arginine kinase-like [Aedes aegypti]